MRSPQLSMDASTGACLNVVKQLMLVLVQSRCLPGVCSALQSDRPA